jgi:hypothetical protein
LILGDASSARYCLDAVDHDLQTFKQLDVDAIIAQRALLYASRVDPQADDWRDQVAAWVAAQNDGVWENCDHARRFRKIA